jgi:sirohydrochlorin ferrochelatase
METDALDTMELSDEGGNESAGGRAEQEGTWLFHSHHYKFERSGMELDHELLCRSSRNWSPPERSLAVPFLSARAAGRLVKSSFRGLFHRSATGNRFGKRSGEGASDARGWRGGRTRGVVVVGHGTADPVGAEETRRVTALVAAMLPDVAVELGFLEVIGPSIGEALERLAARGCTEVVAAPLLLFTAGHARRDVPEAVRDGAARAGLVVRQSEALGLHPDMLALTQQRRHEALAPLAPVPAENTVLLMIGRGSSDPTAHRQLHDFAVASCEEQPPWPAHPAGPFRSRIELGFVAAARPTLDEAIANAAGGGGTGSAAGGSGSVRRVVVQPHLLFRGHVEEQVTAAVDRGRQQHPGIEWVQVQRLGADRLVAQALIDRAAVAFPDAVA